MVGLYLESTYQLGIRTHVRKEVIFMFNQVYKIFGTTKTLLNPNIAKLPDLLCFHCPAACRKRLFS